MWALRLQSPAAGRASTAVNLPRKPKNKKDKRVRRTDGGEGRGSAELLRKAETRR